MSDLFLKDAGYEGSSMAMAKGLIATSPMKKIYWWHKIYVECAAGVCMLLLSPLFALLLALLLVFAVLAELSSKVCRPDTLGRERPLWALNCRFRC
jgi:hypothetical protein